ncbi:hypothetical protein B9Z19DRAFT_1070216 [Tuber borchii]|uniref:Transmembrane protein n=1 Tax=Tuber borchii TaxID=42251 RepID=A0A2T7A9H8_TUBBO|nr:hypothetical protein B9Z19DRAFT_1070216 [Tuber borchii]
MRVDGEFSAMVMTMMTEVVGGGIFCWGIWELGFVGLVLVLVPVVSGAGRRTEMGMWVLRACGGRGGMRTF